MLLHLLEEIKRSKKKHSYTFKAKRNLPEGDKQELPAHKENDSAEELIKNKADEHTATDEYSSMAGRLKMAKQS